MFTLLILLVLAVAAYLVLGAATGRPRARSGNSVAEFSRALDALNPRPRPRRRPLRPSRASQRSNSTRRAA